MTKKPQLDEATRKIAERLLNTPPKPHDEMKIGKGKKRAEPKRDEGDKDRKAKGD